MTAALLRLAWAAEKAGAILSEYAEVLADALSDPGPILKLIGQLQTASTQEANVIITCKVTDEYIDEGCHAAMECPVAKAILAHLTPDHFVMVTSSYITITHYNDEDVTVTDMHTVTPWAPSTWIRAYDSDEDLSITGVSVHPFEFELNVPPGVLA